MNRALLLGSAAASLLLAATVSASAQATSPAASVTTQVATAKPPQPVAGGAAGQMSYATYAWNNMTARLGLGPANPNAPPTAVADAH